MILLKSYLRPESLLHPTNFPDPKIFFWTQKFFFGPKNFFRLNFFWTKEILVGDKKFLDLRFLLHPKRFLAGAKNIFGLKFFWNNKFFGTKKFFYTKKFSHPTLFSKKNSIHALCQLNQVTRFVSTLPQLLLSLAQLSPSLFIEIC